jgi:predicted nucleotidyltransferase component of viral defense system
MKIYSPQAAVELFHLVFLDLLGRKVDKKHYALKGGCNLRFFFNSIRYSENIDMDVSPSLSKEKLKDIVSRILRSGTFEQILDVRGIRVLEKSSPKQIDTTQRWKVALSIPGSSGSLRTKIEFSRRGMKAALAFETINPILIREYQLTPILASHYSREDAFVQKIIALATRRQVQARDVFDLHLLITSGVDFADINDEASKYIDKAKESVWAVSYEMFKSQVVSFLHPEYQAQYSSPELWDRIVLAVVEALEGSKR